MVSGCAPRARAVNLVDRLLGRAAEHPERVAVVTEGACWTYGELMQAVAATARHLRERGVARGECVGLSIDDSFAWIAAYLGTMHAGAVVVPLSPSLSGADCDHVVRSTRMRAAFVGNRAIAGSLRSVRDFEHLVELDDAADLFHGSLSALPPAAPLDRDALAALLFTSGSTSRPRAVMISHGNLIANTGFIIAAHGLSSADRVMVVVPFHWCLGASILHTQLAVGGSLVIDGRFMFADKVLKRMIDTRCTGFVGVPSHYQLLLRRSQFKSIHFPDLRWVQSSGGKLAETFVRELREAKPDLKLFLTYGATEASSRISVLAPEEVDRRPGSIGKPITGVTVRLLDEHGMEVPPGVVGEIVVEGDTVSRGYFEDPAETLSTFRDGRLHTGDLATRDADGFLYIVDRMKNFLKCGGTRTSAARVEEALLSFEDIVEVAVIGVPSDTLGEAVAAFIVPRDLADDTVATRLLNFARTKLPFALQPAVVKILPRLPKGPAGKVLRLALRRQLTSPGRAPSNAA